jgi:hypothetical protein
MPEESKFNSFKTNAEVSHRRDQVILLLSSAHDLTQNQIALIDVAIETAWIQGKIEVLKSLSSRAA